jgi:vitamin B12 transporter
VQWNRGQHLARLSYFETRYRDFINIFPIVNIPGATVKGFEGIYAGRIAGFDVRASVTVQDPLDQVANAPLIRQSRRFGSLGLGRSVGAWTFGMDWRGSGERRDNAIAGGGTVELPHYQTFDLTARYAIDRQWSVGARLENAADQRYMIAHGYNTPRRGVFVTLAYSPR